MSPAAPPFTVPTIASLLQYPALTVGLALFTLVLLVVDLVTGHFLAHKFSLYPNAPLEFDLNRLLFYLLFHQGALHWLFNVIGLFTPMALFERAHGTVHTGITLNLLAVTAGLQFCILGVALYPNTNVIGLSGVVFSFLSFYAFKEHQLQPVLHTFQFQGRQYSIPTLWAPVLLLVVTLVLFPASSFFGHLAGISLGYLLAMGKLTILYPPLKIVLWIEKKVAPAIALLDGVVTFVKEDDAVHHRGVAYTSIWAAPGESV